MKRIIWYVVCAPLLVLINAPGWIVAKIRRRPYTPIGGAQ